MIDNSVSGCVNNSTAMEAELNVILFSKN